MEGVIWISGLGLCLVFSVAVGLSTLSARAKKAEAETDESLVNEDRASLIYKKISQPEGVGHGFWEGYSPYALGAALAVRLGHPS